MTVKEEKLCKLTEMETKIPTVVFANDVFNNMCGMEDFLFLLKFNEPLLMLYMYMYTVKYYIFSPSFLYYL